jgi:uncharacterized membrane protein YjfL (UPF0719 family)
VNGIVFGLPLSCSCEQKVTLLRKYFTFDIGTVVQLISWMIVEYQDQLRDIIPQPDFWKLYSFKPILTCTAFV